LKYTSEGTTSGSHRYIFEYFSRPGFVSHSAIICTNQDDTISSLSLSSSRIGQAIWEANKGLVSCNKWENEEELSSKSYLSKHYQQSTLDGSTSKSFAKSIYEDCISKAADPKLNRAIRYFCLNSAREFRFIVKNGMIE
jgi:hypothetical protein